MDFNRAFWSVFIAVAILQVYGLILFIYYGFDFSELPHEFYLYTDIGGIIWSVLLAVLVISQLQSAGLDPTKIFSISADILKKSLPLISKYFAGCALFIILMSLIEPVNDFDLKVKSSELIILSFVSAVLVAPITEEIVFRGYLYTAMIPKFQRKKERLVVNAMFFAAAHVFLINLLFGAGVPYYIFVLGFLLAKLYEEYRSVLPCIVLHGLNNIFVFSVELWMI